MNRIIFDLEANGLLYDASKIWCICGKDLDTKEFFKFYGDRIEEGLTLLSEYDIIIGHNIYGYDIPLIEKLYPGWTFKDGRDTLCMSKLFNSERVQGHSLESYGIQFKRYKPEHEDWTQFSEEMLHRCCEDVEINCLLYKYLVDKYCKDWSWMDALKLEQEFSRYQAYQELAGVDFDKDLAVSLLSKIDVEVEELDRILLDRIPKRVVPIGKAIMKPFKKDGTYSSMVREFYERI